MEEQWVTAIGLLAAACTTVAFFPQFWKAWKTKSTKDISLSTFMIFWVGVLCWLTYGLLLENLPMILGNSLTIILGTGILALKFRHG